MAITVAEMARRIRQAKDGLPAAAADVLVQHEADIIEAKRQDLYKNGVEGYRYKSDKYARLKNRMNPQPGYGVPDAKLAGAFYDGLELDLSGGGISVKSTDAKTPWLLQRLGPALLKLTITTTGEIRKNMLQPGLVQYIRRVTGAR